MGIRFVGETVAKKLVIAFGDIDSLMAAKFHQLIAVDEIGDINGKPDTFYETVKEAYEHRQNVDSLKTALANKCLPYVITLD